MSDQFVAEIRIFGGNFAPVGWATCDGQILPISQNTALFSLLGTNFGGNGTSNFGLPNLRDSAPLGMGQGPGLSNRLIGETGGAQSVILSSAQMASHGHAAMAATSGGLDSPSGNVWGESKQGKTALDVYAATGSNVPMNPLALAMNGSSQPHNNMPPYLCLTFIIAMSGIYPPRS